MSQITVKGGHTKSKIIYGPEAHKLHLEFPLSPDPDAAKIHQGQPVKLDKVAYGTPSVDYDVVVPAEVGELAQDIIGISIHELDSAYEGNIVVATRGYAVVKAKAKAALDIGAAVKVGGGVGQVYDDDTEYPWISAATDETDHYGWALSTCVADDIIEILVKN
jgi:hypothetical protein